MMQSFELTIRGEDFDPQDDNVDVEIELENGDRYCATFFTLSNIKTLFLKNKESGECEKGLYLWASDMIIVDVLSKQVIHNTIEGLLESKEFHYACSKI